MNDDASSIGQASAAVAMANDAIDNARRAAASSRSRRKASSSSSAPPLQRHQSPPSRSYDYAPAVPAPPPPPPPRPLSSDVAPPTTPRARGGPQPISYSDLRRNDNAYHVLATLIAGRLMPKVDAAPGSTHYILTADDVAFLRERLPQSVRRSFVDALRYRLQLLKSGVGSKDSALGRLTMQCQFLGLDRNNSNVLLDLNQSAGRSYALNYKNQGPVAVPSPPKANAEPETRADQYSINAGTQQSYNINTDNGDNGVTFGLSSPMAFSPVNTASFSPTQGGAATNAGDNAGFDLGRGSMSNADWETSAESLARQQIMAEINETKFLMRGSVTPDAVNFWKKHLEELSQRLVALSLEEQLKAAGSSGGGGGSAVGGVSPGRSGDNYDVKNQYPVPSIQSREYLDNNRHARMGSNVVPTTPAEESYHTQGDPANAMEASVNAVASVPPGGQRDESPVCDVVAPSDLPGGYMFEAQLGSKKFLATVPPGGVTKGQRFVSTMQELETIEIPVPLGAWRDGVGDCCNDGLLHPLFLNTIFIPCIALGQIMTRSGLDWQGDPANKLVSGLSCANMTVLLTFWLAMNASFAFMLRVAWTRGRPIGHDYYAVLAVFNALVLLNMINLTRKVRGSIRNKYQIPEERCVGAEDCCCATFCMPCAICQMGRHTADFDTYRATCCTKTGLPRQVELAPVTFYEDQYQTMNDESQVQVI